MKRYVRNDITKFINCYKDAEMIEKAVLKKPREVPDINKMVDKYRERVTTLIISLMSVYEDLRKSSGKS